MPSCLFLVSWLHRFLLGSAALLFFLFNLPGAFARVLGVKVRWPVSLEWSLLFFRACICSPFGVSDVSVISLYLQYLCHPRWVLPTGVWIYWLTHLLGFHGAYLGTIRQACVPCIMYFVSDKLMSHCLLFAVYLVIPILCLLNRWVTACLRIIGWFSPSYPAICFWFHAATGFPWA